MDPKTFEKICEEYPELRVTYLDWLRQSIHARMGMLPSISALCATLLTVATFNEKLLPLNTLVKILITVLLVLIPISLKIYNDDLKKEQESYIKTLGESVQRSLVDKLIACFLDLAICIIGITILLVAYLIWNK